MSLRSDLGKPALVAFLADVTKTTNAALERVLPVVDAPPTRLHQAMRHSVFAGGKRLRPALVLGAYRAVSGRQTPDPKKRKLPSGIHLTPHPAMAAVELLHTYTLIHDDLPAMDDDDLRRGRPTCHKAFDEATAILAGDALQALAFEVVAVLGAEAVMVLARAVGSRGTVGGQQDDIDAEGLPINDSPACSARLERIHRGKTAALIRAACELGGIAAGADAEQRQALVAYGEAVGLAFQVADDVLDATASSTKLGKTAGKDQAQGKLTYVAVHGLSAARREAKLLARAALTALSPFGERGVALAALARFAVERDH